MKRVTMIDGDRWGLHTTLPITYRGVSPKHTGKRAFAIVATTSDGRPIGVPIDSFASRWASSARILE